MAHQCVQVIRFQTLVQLSIKSFVSCSIPKHSLPVRVFFPDLLKNESHCSLYLERQPFQHISLMNYSFINSMEIEFEEDVHLKGLKPVYCVHLYSRHLFQLHYNLMVVS